MRACDCNIAENEKLTNKGQNPNLFGKNRQKRFGTLRVLIVPRLNSGAAWKKESAPAFFPIMFLGAQAAAANRVCRDCR